jgi:hypothetical protein
MDKIKVLVFAANPKRDLQLDEEIRKIEQKVQGSLLRSLEMISALAARGEDLIDRLNRHRPHIVHFSGHGSRAGRIFFVGDDGKAKPVEGKALATVFRVCKDNIRGACFNACYSRDLAQSLIADGAIDFAIGMNDSIGDEAARIFSAQFYGSLGDGRSVQSAFDQAVAEMMVQGTNQETQPELHVRGGVDASSLTLEPLPSMPGENVVPRRGVPFADHANPVPSMDRLTFVKTLVGLSPPDFDILLAAIPGASVHVSPRGAIPEKAAELVRWAESPKGCGLTAVEETFKELQNP